MNTFLTNLSHALVNMGRKRPWLSEQTGISLNTINNWYYGEQTMPKADSAYKIAQALGTTVEWLVTSKGNMKPMGPYVKLVCDAISPLDEVSLRELWEYVDYFASRRRGRTS